MTKSKTLSAVYCPHCGFQYLELSRNEIVEFEWQYVVFGHPGITAPHGASA